MRKITHEKDRHNKKLKKNPVSTYDFMVGASNELHKEASHSLEKERRRGGRVHNTNPNHLPNIWIQSKRKGTKR